MLSEHDFKYKQLIFHIAEDGDKILIRNSNLIIKDKNDIVKYQYTCYRIFALFIVGNVSITSPLIKAGKEYGFSISLFTTSFRLYKTISFLGEGNTLLRQKQYTTTREDEIAKQIIIQKVENQQYMLKKIRNKDAENAIRILGTSIKYLAINKLNGNEIMGVEGTCAKAYFNRIFRECDWKGRQPRLKRDKINVLLDIAYTILFNFIESILNIYGFDIYKGNLHKVFWQRKSLVCDIIEPFRPIVDYKIRKMINLKQIDSYYFEKKQDQYLIGFEDSRKFLKEILGEILRYKMHIFRFIRDYYRWFCRDRAIELFPKVNLDEEYL